VTKYNFFGGSQRILVIICFDNNKNGRILFEKIWSKTNWMAKKLQDFLVVDGTFDGNNKKH
jgi:hypothetical protein